MNFLKIVSGKVKQVAAIVTSAGAGDANKIVATDSNGRLDSSLMPAGFGAETVSIVASENLTAGNLVNIFDDSGTIKVRKADATNGRKAHGYVLANVTAPAAATVYYGNLNNQVSGLTIGVEYVLSQSTPGGVQTASSFANTTGHIYQSVGVAKATTELLVELQQEIEIA